MYCYIIAIKSNIADIIIFNILAQKINSKSKKGIWISQIKYRYIKKLLDLSWSIRFQIHYLRTIPPIAKDDRE